MTCPCMHCEAMRELFRPEDNILVRSGVAQCHFVERSPVPVHRRAVRRYENRRRQEPRRTSQCL